MDDLKSNDLIRIEHDLPSYWWICGYLDAQKVLRGTANFTKADQFVRHQNNGPYLMGWLDAEGDCDTIST